MLEIITDSSRDGYLISFAQCLAGWQPLSQGQRPQWSLPMTWGPLVDGLQKICPEGKTLELVRCRFSKSIWSGFLNDEGDMFVYIRYGIWFGYCLGYRPTRICHVTSGSEFGWLRTGKMGNGLRHSSRQPSSSGLNMGRGLPTMCLRKGCEISRKIIKSILWHLMWSRTY